MATKKQWYTEDDFTKFTHENFVILGRSFTFTILNNKNFKMEVDRRIL